MDRFSRMVLGYHGCEPAFADALIRGEKAIKDWRASHNPYDWLGHGIYFWEYAPERAKEWGGKGGVIGAVIQLGTCLDLTDIAFTALLAGKFETVRKKQEEQGLPFPENKGKRRDLDCLVINELVASAEADVGLQFQTVRCAFLEGEPAFPGSGILRESHVQIAVRDNHCLLGVFRPNQNWQERIMRDDLIIERLKEAIKCRDAMPADEWFKDMIRRGVLDEQGRVLIRMPEAPNHAEKPAEPPCPPAEEAHDSPQGA